MSGSSNFQQHNPSANNQLTDTQYSTDTTRSGGAVAGIYPSNSFNKFAFQVSTFVAAFGQMMATKGYNVSDANISTLETVMANILTSADTISASTATTATTATNSAGTGTIPKTTETGLRIIRGTVNNAGGILYGTGYTAALTSTGTFTVTFSTPFSAPPSVLVSAFTNSGNITANSNGVSTNNATISTFSGSIATNEAFTFIAIGPN